MRVCVLFDAAAVGRSVAGELASGALGTLEPDLPAWGAAGEADGLSLLWNAMTRSGGTPYAPRRAHARTGAPLARPGFPGVKWTHPLSAQQLRPDLANSLEVQSTLSRILARCSCAASDEKDRMKK